MSITDILIRSISGYIFIIPGLLLYFWRLKKSGKPQTALHLITVLVFCYYLIGVLTMTGIGKLKPFSPRLVWVPFLDMIRGPVDTLLNIILFVPLGFFLPLLYQKLNRIGSVAWTGFLFSLSIETVQLFGRGSTDINDLITNTFGAILGYFVYRMLSRLTRAEIRTRFQANQCSALAEVWFSIVYSLAVMVTIQPFLISKLFHLG